MAGSPRVTVRLPGDLLERVTTAAKTLTGGDLAAYIRVVLDQATRSGVMVQMPVRYDTEITPKQIAAIQTNVAPEFETGDWQTVEREPGTDDFDETALRDDAPAELPSSVRRVAGSAKAGEHADDRPSTIRSIRPAPQRQGKEWAPQHRA
jgi:hypothetical protein